LYRLYGAPGRASAAPEAILEELGVPYEFVEVDAEQRASAEYKRLNPLGQVPTLVEGDRAISEAAAICIYLCDRHPEAGLAPPIDSQERGRFYQWMFFLSNTLQPAYMLFFYSDRYCGEPAGAARVGKDAETRIAGLWEQLESSIAPGPFLVGEHMTAADVYLYMLSTWHRERIVPLSRFSRVSKLLALVAQRPGVKKMMLRNEGH
jgi:glutathione S-transferase